MKGILGEGGFSCRRRKFLPVRKFSSPAGNDRGSGPVRIRGVFLRRAVRFRRVAKRIAAFDPVLLQESIEAGLGEAREAAGFRDAFFGQ
jgi:hypothetical protein